MFLISFLTFSYGFICFLTVLLVLIQRSKGSMGLGNVGGSNQALFGSAGGQDIFQKMTWICLIILLVGSMFLSIAKGKYGKGFISSYVPKQQSMPIDSVQE